MMFLTKELIPDRVHKELYLERYIIFKCRFFGLYLHKFHQGDYDVPHDHPWDFWTWVLSKGYWEDVYTYKPEESSPTIESVFRRPLSLRFVRAETLHKVRLEANKKPWSLCLTFKKRREWGFRGGQLWIHHKKYLRRSYYE